ncbi:MAG: acylphosphatase [Gemmatimonadota bacterium]
MKAAFVVRGRVQGVGFRWWTRKEAHRLGLDGSVRNLPSGAVEVHASGSREAVARLEAALRRGPPASVVEAVDRIPPSDSIPPGFRILP